MSSRRPGPRIKRLLRAPARLYDWHLGWLLGRRFLRLTHVGRRSGRRYETVLEVVGENPRTGELIVVAGFGRSAGWYRNLQAGGAREVAVGMERFVPVHRVLEEAEAEAVLAAYEQRNRLVAPLIRAVLSRLVGWRYDGSGSARRALVRELPMVGLRPRPGSAPVCRDRRGWPRAGQKGFMESRRELLAIEETLWRAAGHRDRYAEHLAADGIHVFPGLGLLDRESILDGVEHAEPWRVFRIEDPRFIELDDGGAALVYRAHAERAGGPTYAAAITSVYRRRDRTWELVVHQQTPLPPR